MRQLFIAILLLASAAAYGGPQPKVHQTSTTVSCAPDPGTLYADSTCTVTVTDLGGQGPDTPPAGTVTFSSNSGGTFSGDGSCTLSPSTATASSCSITYTPTSYDSGVHTITADYSGGSDPNPSTGIVFEASSGTFDHSLDFPPPTIDAISPGSGTRNDTVTVTVLGTGFVAGETSLALGANITVSGITVNSPTELVATLDIDNAAALGPRDVTVSNSAPGGGSDTLVDGFEVRNPVPAIASLTPVSVEEGSGAVAVTIDGNGFVNGSVAYFDGTARPTTFVSSSQLVMDLDAADTATVGEFDVHVVNGGPGGGTSNTEQFHVVAPGGSFDVVEPGETLGGALFTKLAGVSFNVDVIATDVSRTAADTSFEGTVSIQLLDASDDSGGMDANGCRSSWNVVQTLPDDAFGAGDNGRITITLAHGEALRVARFRVSHPAGGAPTHIGCSSDAFSNRPQQFALASTLNNDQPDGAPVHPAGDAFTMTATAIPGYDGTPQFDAGFITAHDGGGVAGSLGGSFPAADETTGESEGSAFAYVEVGHFVIAAKGVYDDAFTAIDQPDDCIAGFSNVLSGGQYGCSFGNTANRTIGRFVPHHFDVTVTHGCSDAGGFTYSGQDFNVNITARAAGGGMTAKYEGAYAKDVELSDEGDTSNFDAGTNMVSSMDFGGGTASDPDTTWRFADPETDYTLITLRAVDEDGASSDGHLEESTEIRSGRLTVGDATTITTLDGLMPVELQTWQETSPGVFEWAVHADDTTCTVLASGNFTLDNFTSNLQAGETTIDGFSYSAGAGTLTLSAPGSGNNGSVDVTANTDPWLEFDWEGNGPEAPVGTMQFFEIFNTEEGFIDRHEIIGN